MNKPGFGTGGPDPLNSTPSPPLKKKESLESGPTLVWGWTPPPPTRPYLGKFSGSRHHYTTSFIKVRAEIYPCKSPGERISFWHFTNKLT